MTVSRELARPSGHGPALAPVLGQGNPMERLGRSQSLLWIATGDDRKA